MQFSSNRCQINLDNSDTHKILAEMADLRKNVNICREVIFHLAKSVNYNYLKNLKKYPNTC